MASPHSATAAKRIQAAQRSGKPAKAAKAAKLLAKATKPVPKVTHEILGPDIVEDFLPEYPQIGAGMLLPSILTAPTVSKAAQKRAEKAAALQAKVAAAQQTAKQRLLVVGDHVVECRPFAGQLKPEPEPETQVVPRKPATRVDVNVYQVYRDINGVAYLRVGQSKDGAMLVVNKGFQVELVDMPNDTIKALNLQPVVGSSILDAAEKLLHPMNDQATISLRAKTQLILILENEELQNMATKSVEAKNKPAKFASVNAPAAKGSKATKPAKAEKPAKVEKPAMVEKPAKAAKNATSGEPASQRPKADKNDELRGSRFGYLYNS